MNCLLAYDGQTIDVEVINSNYQKTEIYYQSLKTADNSVRFTCCFTQELADFLKTNINEDVLVTITDDNGNAEFTGYVRKTLKFSKTQINQPIAIEVVSPSYLLNKSVKQSKAFVNKTIAQIVESLLVEAGFPYIGTLSALNALPALIIVKEGENYREVISQMLYEYGFTFDFDADGFFQVFPLFNLPAKESVTQVFDGTNALKEIVVTAKEHEYDSVKASWEKIDYYTDTLIFRDTTNADQSTDTCKQEVQPGEYFADKYGNILNCDSEYGTIRFIQNIRPDVKTDNSSLTHFMSMYEYDELTQTQGNRLVDRIFFTAKNTGNAPYNLVRIDCYGDVYVANAYVEEQSFGDKKQNQITLKYIGDESHAQDFVRKLTNWYKYATDEISVQSKTDYALGSFVKVSENGIGTYWGRIIKKSTRLSTNIIEYVIETFTDYEPAVSDSVQSPVAGGIGQSSLDALLNKANGYTDDKVTSAIMEASPRYDAQLSASIIKKGNDGAYSPSTLTGQGLETRGDDVQIPYEGKWYIYANGSEQPASVITGTSFSITVNEILQTVSEITSLRVEFKSLSDEVIFLNQTIPVLTNTSAYSVQLVNPYKTFESDASGNVGEVSVVTHAEVYYGLQELTYGTDWEYGIIEVPEGFDASLDVTSGNITITTVPGSTMAESGQIKISVFIRSQTNTQITIGYVEDVARASVEINVGYTENGIEYEIGYLEADENGYFNTYFNYQKLTKAALEIAALTTTVNHYWEVLTSDLSVTVAEKNTLSRLMGDITAEYNAIKEKYSKYRTYAEYSTKYEQLLSAVSLILGTIGNYSFSSYEDKNTFNGRFTAYYTAKENLMAEVASISTNFTGINTTAKIDALDPKPTDFFVWVGTNNTPYSGLLSGILVTGMTYTWNGTKWVQDNDNGHIMATMNEALQIVKNSDDVTIPAITFAKRLVALEAVIGDLSASFAQITELKAGTLTVGAHLSGCELGDEDDDDDKIVLKSPNWDGGNDITAGTEGFAITKSGKQNVSDGIFRGTLRSMNFNAFARRGYYIGPDGDQPGSELTSGMFDRIKLGTGGITRWGDDKSYMNINGLETQNGYIRLLKGYEYLYFEASTVERALEEASVIYGGCRFARINFSGKFSYGTSGPSGVTYSSVEFNNISFEDIETERDFEGNLYFVVKKISFRVYKEAVAYIKAGSNQVYNPSTDQPLSSPGTFGGLIWGNG